MASENVVTLTTDTWQQEVVNSPVPVVVDFWAPWCGPCRALSPVIDRLAAHFAGKVKVGKLNVDDNQEIAVKYGISAIPQVLLFHGSEEPKQRLGFQSESQYVKEINRVLGV
jgi:thioredoxin 1